MKRAALQRVEVEGSAKVNLGWRVTALRDDGYHDVDGLIQTISLVDRVELSILPVSGEASPRDVGARFPRLEVPGHPSLEGDDNLIMRAAAAIAERFDDPPPTRAVLHKAIPIAAGLGGGSADAAATLVGLNALWGAGLAPKQLVEIGASIGSDVPAILVGGLVHASGRGERVRNVGSFDDGWLVIGAGAEHVSAADAYAMFDRVGSTRSEVWAANDLEDAACELVTGLRDRIDAMREVARAAFVSGSGPTVIGVVDDEAAATRAADQVRTHFADVLLAQPSTWGVRLSLGSSG